MRFTAWLILIATLMLWSGNWIVARAVRNDIAPGLATVGRLFIVLAILVPFAWPGLRRKLRALTSKDWRVLAALGLTGGGLHLALQWLALHYTTATSGILYLSMMWAGARCCCACAATRSAPSSFSSWSAPSARFSCFPGWRSKRSSIRRSPLNFAGFLAVLYSAIGSLLLAYAGWSYVVRRLGAARAGATLHLMPAFGVVLSSIFLSEYPLWFHFAGIALILSGVGLSSFKASSASSSR